MDKTININLGGILFQVDEEAFRILRDYLQAINQRFANVQGGHETIEDIESRIAEIFQAQKGTAGVITRENVEKMISVIGKPEEFDTDEYEKEAPVYTSRKKRMYRNNNDKIVGGVCSGIAAYLNSDPVLFRILFVLFTAFFGAGFFIYVGLWIALPVARTDTQKREMYGDAMYDPRNPVRSSSDIGNAFNEVFRAIGRVLYIIFRIFMIAIGTCFVLTGFLFILCFVLIFIFKFPGVYSFDHSGINLINVADFLHYMVNPATVPWIIILTSVAVILPMLALIYWGVKMIFWFSARDGIVSLVALVVWVMAVAALAIIGFNEGVSFAQTAKISAETVLPNTPDTIFIHSDSRIADLKYEKEVSLPHDEYSVFINEANKELYIKTFLNIDRSMDKSVRVEVEKSSSGRTTMDASDKTDAIKYNFTLRNDSLRMDEYFTLPSERKWAADNVRLNLQIPSGTIVKFDKSTRIKVQSMVRSEDDTYFSNWESGPGYWIMTDDGLKSYIKKSSIKTP
jgi:phage shock protein PspC (stress-responsive transcriptional regulator)